MRVPTKMRRGGYYPPVIITTNRQKPNVGDAVSDVPRNAPLQPKKQKELYETVQLSFSIK